MQSSGRYPRSWRTSAREGWTFLIFLSFVVCCLGEEEEVKLWRFLRAWHDVCIILLFYCCFFFVFFRSKSSAFIRLLPFSYYSAGTCKISPFLGKNCPSKHHLRIKDFARVYTRNTHRDTKSRAKTRASSCSLSIPAFCAKESFLFECFSFDLARI